MPTNNKTNQNKKKQPAKPTRPRPRKQRSAKIPQALVHSVCGLTDPFCKHANGAKYPDDSSVRTLPWTYRKRGVMTTSGSGDVATLFFPQASSLPTALPATTSGSTVLTWADYGTMSTLGDPAGYRIVSWGVRFHNICAPLDASGSLHLRTWAVKDLTDLEGVDCLSYNASKSFSSPLQDVKDLVFVGEHSDAMPQIFYDPGLDGTNANNSDTKGFIPMTAYVTGAPNTRAVIEYEIVIHYELTFVPTDNLGMVATPPPASNSLLTQAAAIVTSKAENVFARGVDALGNVIVNTASKALMRLLGTTAPGRVASAGVAMIVD